MTEQINKRSFFEICEELFFGKDSAVAKLAKVRYTEYEMLLWRDYKFPLSEVSASAKKYFAKRFLAGENIADASEEALNGAFDRLYYAVGVSDQPTGCYRRCLRLMGELNECLADLGLRTMKNPKRLLDWLTFEYDNVLDLSNRPVKENGAEIRLFSNEKNLKDFKKELKELKKDNHAMSMHDILRRIYIYRNRSISL